MVICFPLCPLPPQPAFGSFVGRQIASAQEFPALGGGGGSIERSVHSSQLQFLSPIGTN